MSEILRDGAERAAAKIFIKVLLIRLAPLAAGRGSDLSWAGTGPHPLPAAARSYPENKSSRWPGGIFHSTPKNKAAFTVEGMVLKIESQRISE